MTQLIRKNIHLSLLILFCILNNAFVLNAQKCSVNGYVRDSVSGEKLIGVNVYAPDQKMGTTTNVSGYYSLQLPKDKKITLIYSYMGYQKKRIQITNCKQEIRKDISLVPVSDSIKEIKITADEFSEAEISTVAVPLKQSSLLPSLGGETDIMKTLQSMPGVTFGSEGSSDLYVRGGNASQNLILLDNIPLYYVNHLAGFVSIFDEDVINQAKFYKGGIPARYGGRLSSVLDIRMKNGNENKITGEGTLGVVSSDLSLQGPIGNHKTTFIVSGRRFMLDLFPRLYSLFGDDMTLGYTFFDINSKISHTINNNHTITGSFYYGDDNTFSQWITKDQEEKETFKNTERWGNILGSIKWNHIYTSQLFGTASLSYTRYRYNSDFNFKIDENNRVTEYFTRYHSEVKEIIGKYDLEYSFSNDYSLKGGLNASLPAYIPEERRYKHIAEDQLKTDTLINSNELNGSKFSAYLENHITLFDRVKTNLGCRVTRLAVNDHHFLSFQPRLLFDVPITSGLSFSYSYSLMQQHLHLLTYSGEGQPIDLWVPAIKDAPPEKLWGMGSAVTYQFPNDQYEIKIEGFYRKFQDLIAYKEGVSIYSFSKKWSDKIVTDGKGKAYGFECYIKKNSGRLTGWLGYTYSRSLRHFEKLNYGKSYPFKFDRPHEINVSLTYKLHKNVILSANWIYSKGRPITLPDGAFNTIHTDIRQDQWTSYQYQRLYYTSRNNYRLKDYHRFDIGLNYEKPNRWGTSVWKFTIYNLYNRKNPYYYYFKEVETKDNKGTERKLFYKTLFPLIPSISYTFKLE